MRCLCALLAMQYKYASSSKNHITQGQGSVAFRLLNLREDYWFGFFRGNATHPVSVVCTLI